MSRPIVLDEFTADLPNLVEVLVEDQWSNVVIVESINRFINSHPKLMKFQIKRNNNVDNRELLKIFETDWKIQSFSYGEYVEFIFERKNVALM